MPRTKKPAGQAVDRRNGRQLELAAHALRPFSLPRRDPPWHPETRKAWAALRKDSVWSVLTPVDRPVVLAWAQALDRATRFYELAEAEPMVEGSTGQWRKNPLWEVAEHEFQRAERAGRQIGVGALNRANLGLAVIEQKRSLDALNAQLKQREGKPSRADPRVIPGSVLE